MHMLISQLMQLEASLPQHGLQWKSSPLNCFQSANVQKPHRVEVNVKGQCFPIAECLKSHYLPIDFFCTVLLSYKWGITTFHNDNTLSMDPRNLFNPWMWNHVVHGECDLGGTALRYLVRWFDPWSTCPTDLLNSNLRPEGLFLWVFMPLWGGTCCMNECVNMCFKVLWVAITRKAPYT